MYNRTILIFSLPLATLLILISCAGLFLPDFYASETPGWQAQAIGQDITDLLLIAPALLATSLVAYSNSKKAQLLWAAVVLYSGYTFVIYCFAIHFNMMFPVYCFGLGLSVYAFLYFLFCRKRFLYGYVVENKWVIRVTAIFLMLTGAMFYALWLSEIIPAIIYHQLPASLREAGLFTNAVQVLDLSVFLPGIIATAVLLLQKKSLGFLLAPVLLGFFVLMDLTIGFLVLVMRHRGIEGSLVLTIIMASLACISAALLLWYLKYLKSTLAK